MGGSTFPPTDYNEGQTSRWMRTEISMDSEVKDSKSHKSQYEQQPLGRLLWILCRKGKTTQSKQEGPRKTGSITTIVENRRSRGEHKKDRNTWMRKIFMEMRIESNETLLRLHFRTRKSPLLSKKEEKISKPRLFQMVLLWLLSIELSSFSYV